MPNTPELSVKVNNQDHGSTPVQIQDLSPGIYKVEIARESEIVGAYQPQFFTLDIEEGTTGTVVAEIVPNDSFIGYAATTSKNKVARDGVGYLTINTKPETTKVFIDGREVGSTPMVRYELLPALYKIRFEASGYDDLEIELTINEGYNTEIESNLLPIPINL